MKKNFPALARSFAYAFSGIVRAIKSERNFRIHIAMALYVLFFALVTHVNTTQSIILIICCALVMVSELFNTAIEALCDRINRDFDANIALIKDISAGAVLICAASAAAVGLVIFLPRAEILTVPWVLIPFLLSIPIALLFIFKFNR